MAINSRTGIVSSTKHRAKRIKKTIDNSYVPWTSLPHDVLESIHRKLCFTDQVRSREVCTSWQLSPDYKINSSFTLPWVTLYSEDFSTLEDFGKLFDPYSKQVYKVDFSRKDYGSCNEVSVMDSKNGWILFCIQRENGFVLFLRNPFMVEVIVLPELANFVCIAATLTKNPESPDCEFLLLCNPCKLSRLCVARICLSRSKEWSVEYLENRTDKYNVHYMEGRLYCLGSEGGLNRYNLEDRSWELLTKGLGRDQDDWTWERGNLVENDGNLLMVCMLKTKSRVHEWLVFRFDTSEMSWAVQQNLRKTAFFLSGRVLFSGPLMDFNGEKLEDCLLFELEETSYDGRYFDCYSLKEQKPVESKVYAWINRCCDSVTFIEPPYLWNSSAHRETVA